MDTNTQIPSKAFFSVKEFCIWASIGSTTFYNEVKSGNIKTYKIGSKTVVSWQEAMRWANNITGVGAAV